MRSETLFWLSVLALLAGIGAVLSLDSESVGTAALMVVAFGLLTWLAHRVPSDADRAWLAGAIALGFVAKLAGSSIRYLVLARLYDFVGDASRYHRVGTVAADHWRRFQVPPVGSGGSAGTHFVDRVTGLLYVPYQPTMLGGFFIFALVAFVGQLLLYLAFRRSSPPERLPWYAAGIFFLPSMAFWPSSIGKESLMLLFLGAAALGSAHLFHSYRFRWVLMLIGGLAGAAAIRPHVAALFAIAMAVALLLGRPAEVRWSLVRKLVLIGATAVLIAVSVGQVTQVFGVAPTGDDLDPFLADLERRTSQGGSAVEGDIAITLENLPGAAVRVLFRPLPLEARNAQAMASAAESVLLIALIGWNLPRMVRHFRRLRRQPYLLLSLAFVLGFLVIFSAIFNLGILARQRTQALPFLLAVLVGLSVRERADSESPQASPTSSLHAIPPQLGSHEA